MTGPIRIYGNNATIWYTWNALSNNYTQVATGGTNTVRYVWSAWNNTTTTQATLGTIIPAQQVWGHWNYQPHLVTQTPMPTLTAEQVAEGLRVEAEHQAAATARVEAHHAKYRAAQTKALRLLEYLLTAEQHAELVAHKRIHVRGSRGRRYCIHANGQSGNVHYLNDKGEIVGRLCAHPGGYLPDADAWLAQLLALQDNEDAFCAIANVHWGRKPDSLDQVTQRQVSTQAAFVNQLVTA